MEWARATRRDGVNRPFFVPLSLFSFYFRPSPLPHCSFHLAVISRQGFLYKNNSSFTNLNAFLTILSWQYAKSGETLKFIWNVSLTEGKPMTEDWTEIAVRLPSNILWKLLWMTFEGKLNRREWVFSIRKSEISLSSWFNTKTMQLSRLQRSAA